MGFRSKNTSKEDKNKSEERAGGGARAMHARGCWLFVRYWCTVHVRIVPQLAPWRARIDSSMRGLSLAGAEVAPGIDTDPGRPVIGAESFDSLFTTALMRLLTRHCAPSQCRVRCAVRKSQDPRFAIAFGTMSMI